MRRRILPADRCPRCTFPTDGPVSYNGWRYCVRCGCNLSDPAAAGIDWTAARLAQRQAEHLDLIRAGIDEPPTSLWEGVRR